MKSFPKIAISIGDLAGIGPEVAVKSLMETDLTSFAPILYASEDILSQTLDLLGAKSISIHLIDEPEESKAGHINLLKVWTENLEITLGKPTEQSGAYAFKSLDSAVSHLLDERVDALVTAPIDKNNTQSEQFRFPGHTEYLAHRSETSEYLMLLVSGGLRVGVVTGHIPVSAVASSIDVHAIVAKLKVIDKSLKEDFRIASPRIAVLGLNPHAGDQGLIGHEEQETIIPAIKAAQALGIGAEGPFPADGLFGSSSYKDFDAILAMYHDQGLVPFKALSFGTGVNFTAGLPIIRTSPDHGTAFDIAGKNLADIGSFLEALTLATQLAGQRFQSQ